jgi:hypothetical protein
MHDPTLIGTGPATQAPGGGRARLAPTGPPDPKHSVQPKQESTKPGGKNDGRSVLGVFPRARLIISLHYSTACLSQRQQQQPTAVICVRALGPAASQLPTDRPFRPQPAPPRARQPPAVARVDHDPPGNCHCTIRLGLDARRQPFCIQSRHGGGGGANLAFPPHVLCQEPHEPVAELGHLLQRLNERLNAATKCQVWPSSD